MLPRDADASPPPHSVAVRPAPGADRKAAQASCIETALPPAAPVAGPLPPAAIRETSVVGSIPTQQRRCTGFARQLPIQRPKPGRFAQECAAIRRRTALAP